MKSQAPVRGNVVSTHSLRVLRHYGLWVWSQEEVDVNNAPDGAVHQAGGRGQGHVLSVAVEKEHAVGVAVLLNNCVPVKNIMREPKMI